MSNTKRSATITGKISANPNPVFFGQGCVVVSWETNDRRGAEVRVSTSPDQETLVTSGGKCGHIEIPWIADSKTYNFGLYGNSQPEARLDSRRATAPGRHRARRGRRLAGSAPPLTARGGRSARRGGRATGRARGCLAGVNVAHVGDLRLDEASLLG